MTTKVLCIETTTKNCSVALFENQQLLACKEEGGQYSHAEKLASFVDELLQENELSYSSLNAVAVSKGPGSYTGLRIGVSYAKGLCFGLQIPLIAIDTLLHMAWGAVQLQSNQQALFVPMIDARRMEVYTATYNADLETVDEIQAKVISEGSFQNQLHNQKVFFFGDGAAKCATEIQDKHAIFLNIISPSAKDMGALAFKAYSKKEFEDLAYFEPFYLKNFVALKSKKAL